MRFTKEKLSELAGKAKKLINSPMKKAIITTVAIAAVAFHTNPIALADDSKLTTDHDVNYNDTYIGAVSDKNDSSKALNEKLETLNKSYKYMNLYLDSNIKYNPENVKKLQNTINLKAEAAAIEIDGKPVVYVDNKNTAKDVLRKLELQYVNEDQLKEFEAGNTAALPPLTPNESRILDIHFSTNVSVQEVKAAPDKILPLDQAVSYLQQGTLEVSKYIVKDGDVLGSIANDHQLKIEDLIALNPGLTVDSTLNIGQELNVTMPKPFVEVVIEREVNQQEAIAFQTEVKEDPNMAKGDSRVSQQGQNGLQNVTYHISEQNGTIVKKDATNQEVIQQPINQVVINGTKVIPSRGEGSFAWPASGGYISSTMGYRWGKMHKGIDIARPGNLTIKAADNGVVVSAGWDNGGYGNKIVIDHQNGFRTVYAHLSSIGVRAGQTVAKGSPIGVMGATGDATGVHLHFEVYKNGALQDPLSYVGK